jgi:DNA (cytosine-5)-methyltransferase 1
VNTPLAWDAALGRPLLLDAYCGAGGIAWGYWLAGFAVIGIDHQPQPHYPFPFFQGDAVKALGDLIAGKPLSFTYQPTGSVVPYRLKDVAAIHASCPCQFATVYGNNKAHVKQDHPNLIPPTRELLAATGLPYVIENVYGARAHLKDPVMLCGTSFGIEVRRHRLFESTVTIPSVPCDHGRFTARKYPGSSNRPNGRTVCNIGEYRVPLAVQQAAIGISWMNLAEIAQAIPPCYTEFIGMFLMNDLILKGREP